MEILSEVLYHSIAGVAIDTEEGVVVANAVQTLPGQNDDDEGILWLGVRSLLYLSD